MKKPRTDSVLKRAAKILRTADIRKGDLLLLALSGGTDSVCLLHVLLHYQEKFGFELHVAHINHGLRGREADSDEEFVRALCERHRVLFHRKRLSSLTLATPNLEERCRELRYQSLEQIRSDIGARYLVVAHNADDQAETIMLRMLRGTGVQGLIAMTALGPGPLLRPLLHCWRSEITSYLERTGAAHVDDSSNSSSRILRNRVRADLLPHIESRYAPRFREKLAALASELVEITNFVSAAAEKELAVVLSGAADGDIIDLQKLREVPPALVAPVLRAWIERLAGSIRGIYRAHIDDLRELAFDGPSNGSIDLPRGWKVLRNYNSLQLKHRQLRRAAVPYSIKLVGSGETLIEPAAMKIRAEVMSCRGLGRPSDLWEAHFDADSIEGPLTARNFKEGDRLVPLGMKGRRKVKDIFIDRKVPISLRRRVPLIVAGESIAWVPGIVRADVALLTPKTRRALRLVADPFIASKTISVLAS